MNTIWNDPGSARSRRSGGFVLPAVLFSMVVLMTITTVSLRSAIDERAAARAMRESGSAALAGENGIALTFSKGDPYRTAADETDHLAFPVKARQSSIDSVALLLTPGQKYDFGWEMQEDGTQFRSVLRRCDDGSDPAYMLTVQATGGPLGTASTQRMFLTRGSASSAEGFVVDGDLRIAGQMKFLGGCATIQANGLLDLAGLLVTDAQVMGETTTVTGSVCEPSTEAYLTTETNNTLSPTYSLSGSGYISDTDPVTDTSTRTYATIDTSDCDPLAPAPTVESNATAVAVVRAGPLDYCGQADFFLRNGWLIEAGTLDSIDIDTYPTHGWNFRTSSSGLREYYTHSATVSPGTVCADGDVKVTHPLGSSLSPTPLSIISSGSVAVTIDPSLGMAFLTPDHSSGAAIVAAGDVRISGNLEIRAASRRALVYAGSQCEMTAGLMVIEGRVICADDADPIAAANLTDRNRVSTSGTITFDLACVVSSSAGPETLRPISQRAWHEVR